MSKFVPNLADEAKPLRDFFSQRLFMDVGTPSTGCVKETVKRLLSSTPVLALYDPNAKTTVSADASRHGLGVVLLQEQMNGDINLFSYISRLLSPTEEWYAQIEKEALAFTWACESCLHLI